MKFSNSTRVARALAALVTGSFAAAAAADAGFVVKLEAERMAHRSGGHVSRDKGTYVFTEAGRIADAFSVPTAGAYLIAVRASADLAQKIGAQVAIKIDGKAVGGVMVATTDLRIYTVPATLSAGSHRISLAFTNDFYDAATGEDRNLIVDYVSITSAATAPVIVVPTPAPAPVSTPAPGPVQTPAPAPSPVPSAGYQFPTVTVVNSSVAMTAVPTFNNVGLYWTGATGRAGEDALVRYRLKGAAGWTQGHPLWFDARTTDIPVARRKEFRGSVVNLVPNSTYEVQALIPSSGEMAQSTFTTWTETFPIARTVIVPNGAKTLVITDSGSAAGYVLYTAAPGTKATIDVAHASDVNVQVNASFVIVQNLILKNANTHGIVLGQNVHDVVLQDNDISGWGSNMPDGMGRDLDSGITTSYDGVTANTTRLVIQRNRIHNPRTTANNWTQPRASYGNDTHPYGPQGISTFNTAGQIVVRFNEIFSDDAHHFNDGFGGADNFSFAGSPNRDSDIYGNVISYAWDDCVESEGANMNVRVYNNFLDKCYVMIAHGATSLGPVYDFRNVMYRGEESPTSPRGGMFKLPSPRAMVTKGGRNYLYHNTAYRSDATAGVNWGLVEAGEVIQNTVTRNNVISASDSAISDWSMEASNNFDYDLYTGTLTTSAAQEHHGIAINPSFESFGAGLGYVLKDKSAGVDAGAIIPNFNDTFLGAAPDMGAQERGAAVLKFGVP